MRLVPLLTLALLAAPAFAQAPSAEGRWQAVEAGGLLLEPADGVVLDFAKGQLTGSTGCNRFFGAYALMPGMALGEIGMTRMGCSGRANLIEAAVTSALAQVNDWRLAGDGALELLHDDQIVLRALPRP